MKFIQNMEAIPQTQSEPSLLKRPFVGRTALFTGVIFGLILGVIDIAHAFLLGGSPSPISGDGFISQLAFFLNSFDHFGLSFNVRGIHILIYSGLLPLLLLFASFVAGLVAARKTRQVLTGFFAAFWTGGIFLVCDLCIAKIFFLTPEELYPAMTQPFLFQLLVGLVLLILSLALGALGGLVSKRDLLKRLGSSHADLVIGLTFGLVTGIIDFVYSYLLSRHDTFFGLGIPFRLYPGRAEEPYFHVFWNFFENIPIYLLLALVFLLIGSLRRSQTKKEGVYASAVTWTVFPFLVMDFFMANMYVFSYKVFPQLGELARIEVARAVLIPALLYSLVAGVILIFLGLSLSWLGGRLAGRRQSGSSENRASSNLESGKKSFAES
ncbi:MAG TPA: hypothetical protein VFN35_13145 [Ktedonobacteraceae bacterium]|nr:hypothetical protein [Ktedonobacteraceae bacterium]